jgi:hypothetical protein
MSRLDRFDWVRFVTWAGLMLAGVAQVIVLVCVVLWIGGCATQERQDATKQEARTLERSTETVKQAYVDGQLIELREKTVVTERELTDGATSGERRVELEPPKARWRRRWPAQRPGLLAKLRWIGSGSCWVAWARWVRPAALAPSSASASAPAPWSAHKTSTPATSRTPRRTRMSRRSSRSTKSARRRSASTPR